jgi:hypothetical protein
MRELWLVVLWPHNMWSELQAKLGLDLCEKPIFFHVFGLCRYLEASGCVGMCVNVCKVPTQDFFTKEFGLPLTMNPSKPRPRQLVLPLSILA